MLCICCKKEIPIDSKFCSHCGEKQQNQDSTLINKINGDDNVTSNIIGDHNKIKNVIFNQAKLDDDICYVDRSYKKQISVMGTPIRTKWMILIGAIGTLADFITVYTSIFTIKSNIINMLSLLFLILFFIVFITGVLLCKFRFIPFLGGYSVESNKDGFVFITKITGKCNKNKCDGNLSLRQIKIDKNRHETIVQCSRNPEHRWSFDYTIFDDSDLK